MNTIRTYRARPCYLDPQSDRTLRDQFAAQFGFDVTQVFEPTAAPEPTRLARFFKRWRLQLALADSSRRARLERW